MANSLPPSRSFFPGLALLFVGALLLVHNYRGLDISQLFHYWWPLIIIFWGAIKLYERAVASRSGRGISTISGGEILLVLGLLSLLGVVAASDIFRRDRKSTRLNSSHRCISYAVFCLKKKT